MRRPAHSVVERRWLLRLAGATLAAPLLAACGRKQPAQGRSIPPGGTVLALGDSITFGTGSAPEASYPSVLARLTGWNVVNAGVPGDTSAQALARLPDLLQEHKPQLVLVSIGGNDFLRRLGDADVKNNVRRIAEQSVAAGAQVLLIAVPRPTLAGAATGSLGDHGLFGELATELKLPLHKDGWSTVLGDEKLRSDPIHANAAGYEQFARGVAATAAAAGLLSSVK
jgi:acyl-CoA thioesterase-1